jgi:hypothetical protein
MQSSVMAGNGERQSGPVPLESQSRTIHGMMRFRAALALLTQIRLELVTVLAKVMQHASPLCGFRQQRIDGFSEPVGQSADTAQMILQQVRLPCSILRVRQKVHG